MKIKRRIGFTLVELLVVISIIALLLSILMPALSKVREQGRAILCLNNATQLGKACMVYAQDNQDRYPDALTFDEQAGWLLSDLEAAPYGRKGDFWEDRLLPYVNTQYKVFTCPTVMAAEQARVAGVVAANPNGKARGYHARTLQMNAYLGGYRPQSAKVLGGDQFSYGHSMKIGWVKRPGSVAMFSDMTVWGFSQYYGDCFRDFTDSPPWHELKYINESTNKSFFPYQIWGLKQRQGKGTWAFADGHAEKLYREFSNKSINFNGSKLPAYAVPPRQDMCVNPGHPDDLSGRLNWGPVP